MMTATPFPPLQISAERINPKSLVEPGTSMALMTALLIGGIVGILITLVTYGIALLAVILGPLWQWYLHKRGLALIKGSGIKIGPSQLTAIHDCVTALAERLGLDHAPDIYLVQDSILNAFAVRFGGRHVILLTDDMVNACVKSGDPNSLTFIIAHEMAHIALGHNGAIRNRLRKLSKKLSRLDELSCDNIGKALCQQPQHAVTGLVILAIGPHLLPFVNFKALLEQAQEVARDKYSAKAENQLAHPLLLKRLLNVARENPNFRHSTVAVAG